MNADELIGQFKEELMRFVIRHVKDPDDAKDIHQEILIKIYNNYRQLQHKERLKAWIYRIAHNTVMDHYRRTKYHQRFMRNAPVQEDQWQQDLAADETLTHCLRPFVNNLKSDYKEALLLTDLGNLSQKEYAQRTGKSYSGAKSTIQRARMKLKEMFRECCHIEADKYGTVLSVAQKNNCSCP